MGKKDISVVRRFKEQLSKKVPIKKVILFGSRANGKTHRWSDFDIIIVSNSFKGKRSFERGLGFYQYWNQDFPVDFLCYTPEEFSRLKKKITIVKTAVEKGVEI